MKKKIFLTALSLFILLFSSVHADVKDGQYNVKVSLLKAYEDGYSMGNNALLSDATLYVSNGSGRLVVNFVPIEINGFTGYLGDMTVNGVPATVISTYGVTDSYNDAENGIDPRMKGRQYPQLLEFPVDINSSIQSCSIYVPVMAEMGVGDQSARLQIVYPEGFYTQANEAEPVQTEPEPDQTKSTVSETQTNLNEKEAGTVENDANSNKESNDKEKSDDEKEKEEKFYTLPIELWHSVEDKESMGNSSMSHLANLHVKDGKMTIYIGSDKMEVSDITASLIDLYYDNGKEYVKADAYSYNVKIEGYDELRPQVFSLPLSAEQEYLSIMLNPKVEAMGDDPIKARLKLHFSEKKEIPQSEAGLIEIANNGVPKPAYDSKKAQTRTDKGIKIDVPPNTFEKEYNFYANQIRGERLIDYEKEFDTLDIVKVYELSALGDLPSIPYDAKSPINSLREVYQPSGTIKIHLPVKAGVKDLKLYVLDGDEKKELDYTLDGEDLSFEYDKLTTFAVVYNEEVDEKAISNTEGDKNVKKEASGNESKDNKEIKQMMKNGKKSDEHYGFIIFFIILIVILLGCGVYFSLKYLKDVKRELYYGEELKNMKGDKK